MFDLKTKKALIKITFQEPLLGTAPANTQVYNDFIASKAPDASTIEDEIASLGAEAVIEKGMTVFPRNNGRPFVYDYQIKGFFKDSCAALKKIPGTESSSLKAYKKEIDGLIFVSPRKIEVETDKPIGTCQRPLRASTPQGERVALAASEQIEAGATMLFQVDCLKPELMKNVIEWLDYGSLRGLGAWRNSGMGKFTYEILD